MEYVAIVIAIFTVHTVVFNGFRTFIGKQFQMDIAVRCMNGSRFV